MSVKNRIFLHTFHLQPPAKPKWCLYKRKSFPAVKLKRAELSLLRTLVGKNSCKTFSVMWSRCRLKQLSMCDCEVKTGERLAYAHIQSLRKGVVHVVRSEIIGGSSHKTCFKITTRFIETSVCSLCQTSETMCVKERIDSRRTTRCHRHISGAHCS